jgi:hypothetical protein
MGDHGRIEDQGEAGRRGQRQRRLPALLRDVAPGDGQEAGDREQHQQPGGLLDRLTAADRADQPRVAATIRLPVAPGVPQGM